MTTLEEPLSRLDGSLCMAIRDDSQHQQALQSVYSALEDVLKLPRLQLIAAEAGIIVPIVERCLHRLVPACAPLVLSIHNAARLLVQYIDWMGALLPKYAPTSHQHADAIALVCAVVTCASPPQLHTVLPDPTLDCMARLIHNATPDHASWLLACAVQAIDTAYTIPPHPSPGTPEILAALVSLDQLRSMVARVSTGGHTMPLLQTAISTAHMPQHAAAAAMALGCLQSLAAGSGVDHNASNAQRFALACMVAQSFTSASASIIASCSGLLAVMPVAQPTAMLSSAWYWALTLGACALHATHHAACVGRGAPVVLPQALAGRDALHVVAHVLFEHALVVPAWNDTSPQHLAALLHAPLMGPATPHPPAPPLTTLLLLQLASLPPRDPATTHAHTMLHTVVRAGALTLFHGYRNVVVSVERGALGELVGPLGALCRQAFDATVGVLAALMAAMGDGREEVEDDVQAWQGAWANTTPPTHPPTPVYPLDGLALAQQREGSVAEVLLQGHVQLERGGGGGGVDAPQHTTKGAVGAPPPHTTATAPGAGALPGAPPADTQADSVHTKTHTRLACAADAIIALSCVVVARPPIAPHYAHVLKHSLQVLATGVQGPAQQWAPMSVIETWPRMEVLMQPAPPGLGTGAIWQHDAVLAARMQVLLGCVPPLCPVLPPHALTTTILPIAQLFLLHSHPPCCDAALDACCACLQHVDDGVKEGAVPAVVGRLLEGVGRGAGVGSGGWVNGWGAEEVWQQDAHKQDVYSGEMQVQEARARLGIETCLKLLPSASVASMRCVQLVLDHAVGLLAGGGCVVLAEVMGRLVGVCVLVIDYQMWYAALELVSSTVLHDLPHGPAIALVNAMHGVLTMGDDYTRKLRLATWYTSMRETLVGRGNGSRGRSVL